jgi:tetratricopeptide (TPR) repeat protein
MAWAFSGLTHGYLGEFDEAERRLLRYKRLSPLDPHAFLFDNGIAFTHLLKRDYESAVAVARQVSRMNPAFSNGLKPYLAALGHLGHKQEATVVLGRLLAIEPNFTVQRFLATTPFKRAQDLEHYADGLRRAGVPESNRPI